MKPYCTPTRAESGFTLIEIIVVVVIIATLAVVALPSLTTGDSRRLELTAAELVSAISGLRQQAALTGTPYGLTIFNETQYSVSHWNRGWKALTSNRRNLEKPLKFIDVKDHKPLF